MKFTHIEKPKRAEAHRIVGVTDNPEGPGSAGLDLDDGSTFNVDRAVTSLRGPQIGDYLVRWEDGTKIRIRSPEEFDAEFAPL